jgi:hypothetical protein
MSCCGSGSLPNDESGHRPGCVPLPEIKSGIVKTHTYVFQTLQFRYRFLSVLGPSLGKRGWQEPAVTGVICPSPAIPKFAILTRLIALREKGPWSHPPPARSVNWKPWIVSIIMAAGPGSFSCAIPRTLEAWMPICPAAQRTNGMVMNG